MFGLLSGVRCYQCGMAFENDRYRKNERGETLYWINHRICNLTEIDLFFCGPQCSTEWHEKAVACKNVTQENLSDS